MGVEKYNFYIFPHLYIGSLEKPVPTRQPVKAEVVSGVF